MKILCLGLYRLSFTLAINNYTSLTFLGLNTINFLQKILKAAYYLILYIVVNNLVHINKNGSVNLKVVLVALIYFPPPFSSLLNILSVSKYTNPRIEWDK